MYAQKPTRCTISQISMINYCTCFGQVHCPSSGVPQHCMYAIGICHATSVGCQLTTPVDNQLNQHDKYLLCTYSVEVLLMKDSGPVRNMYSSLSKKFKKQCISLAFIIKIYHDARSSESQIQHFLLTHDPGQCFSNWVPQNPRVPREENA